MVQTPDNHLRNFIRESIKSHLLTRGVDPDKTQVIIDEETGFATFLLWNASGQLVGYQRYNPTGSKDINGHPKSKDDRDAAKYFTWIADEGAGKKIAVWGLETLLLGDGQWPEYFFIAEGVFDIIKVHNAGYPGIAVMTNNPQHLVSWFQALPSRIIAICDNDKAGRMLSRVADEFITVPDPYKDLGDMPQDEVEAFLNTIIGA